jgi:hypothetical protein
LASQNFLGIANERGDAAGLGIPHAFVSRDIWETVAYGADGVLVSVILLPFTLYDQTGIKWSIVAIVLVAVLGSVILFYWLRRSQYRHYVLALWILASLHLHIFAHSASQIQDRVRDSLKCLQNQGCAASRVPNRLLFTESEGSLKERTGMLLTMNQNYLIMIADGGLFIVPVGSIRSLETAKPLPMR